MILAKLRNDEAESSRRDGTRAMILLAVCARFLFAGPSAFAQNGSTDWNDSWTPVAGGWAKYVNERFGTLAEIPRHLFSLDEPPPANGDGRSLSSKDGAKIWIYASYGAHVVTDTFEEYKALLLKESDLDRVTYKVESKTWLARSGTKGQNIVYEKVIEGCGAAHTFRITYPDSRKTVYDPVVTRIARSLGCQKHEDQ